ncbi:MAG: hypothetical protein JXQ83_11970 [Candidatus Glassbacteria bacterium]|nr:hypothetical protein [Candidatus Glassbacteria bacterium]
MKSTADSSSLEASRKSGITFGLNSASGPFSSWGLPGTGGWTLKIGLSRGYPGRRIGFIAACERLNLDLDGFQEIYGVQALQEALTTGVEFVHFSRDFTTYSYGTLSTRIKFPLIESRNLRTGIFFDF